MANITVRNIPDSIFKKIKFLSEIDRRSLNNEILVVLESGTRELENKLPPLRHKISVETQIALWNELSGSWKDSKSKKETIKQIYATRSYGRDVSL